MRLSAYANLTNVLAGRAGLVHVRLLLRLRVRSLCAYLMRDYYEGNMEVNWIAANIPCSHRQFTENL